MTGTLSKRLVAQRELEAAIRLLLQHRDHVSAYVLAWAAYDIVGPISRSRGIQSIEEEFEGELAPASLKDWRKMRRRHYNFFKHADRDPDEVVDDVPRELVEAQIFISNLDFQGAFETLSPIQALYMSWFTGVYPQFVRPESEATIGGLARLIGFPDGAREELTAFFLRMLDAYDAHPDFAEMIKGLAPAGKR